MSYLALYRKYRPHIFDDVIGQDHIVRTLQNQIKTGRISHAYLFTGSRGTGKTTIAKIFARAVNCGEPVNGSACGLCENCQRIESGASINIIELDAASHNSVDNIREINEEVKYTPAVGKYKVYIIDEVHMLSTSAFNALLKTLEEPPAHVIFVLATTDPQKIPVTILSRCQRFDFKRISAHDIEVRLREYMDQEAIQIEDEALGYIARLADGGMRDALSILEQCISFYFDEMITLDKVLYLVGAVDSQFLFDMVDAVGGYDSQKTIEICDKVNMQGRSLRQFNNDLLLHVRNLLVVKATNTESGVLDYSKEYIEKLKAQADTISVGVLMRYIKVLSDLDVEMKVASNQKILLELAMLKLCEPAMDTAKVSVEEKLMALEAKLERLAMQGIQVQQVAAPVEAAAEKVIKPTRLPEAVPEDIKALPAKWPQVIAKLGPGARMSLSAAEPGVIEGDVLYIVHGINMEPSVNRYIDELRGIINEVAGKEVKVVPISAKVYAAKTTEVHGSHPEVNDVTQSISDTFRNIQSKLNYDVRKLD
ncbi:MAG: DNA polymerase III subunit gamma/tau [Cellulosilyticaceae bacterium]